MRVLQVHNRYRSDVPSGENVVVDAEAAALRAAGAEVLQHLRSSDEIDSMSLPQRATLAIRPFYSREDVAAVTSILRTEQPDVLHLHNPNPLISLAVVDAAARCQVPVVMTVHNHRHTCVKGTFRRGGKTCHDCVGSRTLWPAVAHGCYRGSRPQSLVAAGALVAHRSSVAKISRFIAISSAMRSSLLTSGVRPARIVVNPHGVPDPDPSGTRAGPPPAGRFLFVGRLVEEKGVALLLDAWSRRPPGELGRLTVVGSGPLEPQVRRVADLRGDVDVLGRLDAAAVGEAIEASTVVLVPSVWDEPFGLVVLEAYARRRPVISTGLGGLADLMHDDSSWTVRVDPGAWAQALADVTPADAVRKGEAGRRRYEVTYRPDILTRRLIGIYQDVVAERCRQAS